MLPTAAHHSPTSHRPPPPTATHRDPSRPTATHRNQPRPTATKGGQRRVSDHKQFNGTRKRRQLRGGREQACATHRVNRPRIRQQRPATLKFNGPRTRQQFGECCELATLAGGLTETSKYGFSVTGRSGNVDRGDLSRRSDEQRDDAGDDPSRGDQIHA